MFILWLMISVLPIRSKYQNNLVRVCDMSSFIHRHNYRFVLSFNRFIVCFLRVIMWGALIGKQHTFILHCSCLYCRQFCENMLAFQPT